MRVVDQKIVNPEDLELLEKLAGRSKPPRGYPKKIANIKKQLKDLDLLSANEDALALLLFIGTYC